MNPRLRPFPLLKSTHLRAGQNFGLRVFFEKSSNTFLYFMSLHAQLSPEAQARLASQRRTSTITSLIIALLMMVLLGVILLIITMAMNSKEIPQIVSYSGSLEEDEQIKQKKVQTQVERKPAAPSSSVSKVIAANTASPVAVPVPEIDVPEVTTDFGDGNDFGDGWGDGTGTGSGFANIPTSMKKRCSRADRLERLLSNGGNEQCEEAVVASLRWLKKTQNKDGSWVDGQKVGMTGLALLAYLGHCETAQSEEFGEAVLGAITYLVDIAMKNNGKMAVDFKENHWCYEHSIAVYALAEAYTLCVKSFGENIEGLEEAVLASGQFLINSQHKSGGWDYAYSEDSARGGDTSIVGWHLQALKASKYTGLPFKNIDRCSKNGLDYIDNMQASNGAIGYASNTQIHDDGTTLAAVGGLCAQIWKSSSNSIARKACKYIDDNIKFNWNSPDADLYGHYYAVQAMLNNGGKSWTKYNSLFRDQVLNNQEKDGSYKDLNKGAKINATAPSFQGTTPFNVHYRTCLATLMLEAYYRFLPATGSAK